MTLSVPLKESAFTPERIFRLGSEICQVHQTFLADEFSDEVLSGIVDLELKARIEFVSDALKRYLPSDYKKAVEVLLAALPANDDAIDSDFGLFIYAPHSHFVAANGLKREHLQVSLGALEEFTKWFSAEEALRHFLNAFENETMEAIKGWTSARDHRVRRLASEGTRPRLPWAIGIDMPPQRAIPILDALHADTSSFVTRSVANHMNDLSRIDSELVLDTLRKWAHSRTNPLDRTGSLARRSLRTLLTTGHGPAFRFLGYATPPGVAVTDLQIRGGPIGIGADLVFDLTLCATRAEPIMVDFSIAYADGQGGQRSAKVFKLRDTNMAPGQELTITKRRPMKQLATRKLHTGEHKLAVSVNGTQMAEASFVLEEA